MKKKGNRSLIILDACFLVALLVAVGVIAISAIIGADQHRFSVHEQRFPVSYSGNGIAADIKIVREEIYPWVTHLHTDFKASFNMGGILPITGQIHAGIYNLKPTSDVYTFRDTYILLHCCTSNLSTLLCSAQQQDDKLFDGLSQINADSVISCCFKHTYNMGHFLLDFIPAILHFDLKSLHGIKIAYSRVERFQAPLFKALDIPNENLLPYSQTQLVFAREIYALHPTLFDSSSHYFISIIRKHLVEHFNLDTEPPSKFIFFHRISESRMVMNYEEIKDEILTRYWDQDWEFVSINDLWTTEIAAQMFNAGKFAMMMHGAGCTNCIFMQPNAVFCEIHSNRLTNFYHHVQDSCHLKGLYAQIPRMEHFWHLKNCVPVELVCDLIGRGLKLLAIAQN